MKTPKWPRRGMSTQHTNDGENIYYGHAIGNQTLPKKTEAVKVTHNDPDPGEKPVPGVDTD